MEECGVSLCGSTVQPRELLSQTPPLIDDTCSIQHSHQDPTHIEGMLSDRSIGKLLFAANTAAILYYILWIGVMPFVDPSHFTQRLFLPREYGLLLAALCLMGGLGLSVTLASFHMINKTGYFEGVDGSTQTGAAAIPKDTRATKLK